MFKVSKVAGTKDPIKVSLHESTSTRSCLLFCFWVFTPLIIIIKKKKLNLGLNLYTHSQASTESQIHKIINLIPNV